MKVFMVKGFANQDTCDQLNAWVDMGVQNQWLGGGINKNSNWDYQKRLTTRNYGDRFEYPAKVYEVFDSITKSLKLQDLPKSVAGKGKDGVVVSCTYPGGDVYSHTDPMEGVNLHVLRCNIVTRKPDAGGKLFIGGQQIDIEVGDLHCYLASAVPHYVTTVEGGTSRVLWMFGYQATPERFAQIKVA